MKNKHVQFLKKIIRVRKKLIQMKKGKINPYEAARKIQEIEKYLEAYGKKYGEDYWKEFIQRRKADILFLIPANKAEDAYLKELNELL